MSNITDLMMSQVTNKGWLSISSLFFNNSYSIELYKTGGEICASPSKELLFFTTPSDTTDSSNILSSLIRVDGSIRHNELLNNISVLSFDVIEHVNLALYAWRTSLYVNTDGKMAMPKIPTKVQLDALVQDPVTKLYAATDTITVGGKNNISAVGLYNDVEGSVYSGAVVDEWKKFYSNHDKFVDLVKLFIPDATDLV